MGEDKEPEEAAEEAVDPDRLLPGEDPNTTWAEDILMYRQAYADLVDFKRDLISSARDDIAHMSPLAAKEASTTDLVILEEELARLLRRLEFWQARAGDQPER
jgi:hypothetical protein